MKTFSLFCLIVAFSHLAAPLQADQIPAESSIDSQPVSLSLQSPSAPFAQGTWAIGGFGEFSIANIQSTGDHRPYVAGVSAGYYFLDNLSINLELGGYRVLQDSGDAWGIGENFVLRWHFYNVDRLSFFFDAAGGFLQFDRDVPSGGTRNNFTFGGGPGVAFRIADHTYLMGGPRYMHISNGQQHGNPSIDKLMGFAGVMFTF